MTNRLTAMELDGLQWFIIGFLLLLPILYEVSNTFKYYTKFIYFYTVINLSAFPIIAAALPRPCNVENHRFVKWWFQNVLGAFGVKTEIRGEENLASTKPYIIVCNHQSSLDFIGMMQVWPDRCAALAKRELLYAGTFGVCAWLCGTVFINRVNKEDAKHTMADAIASIKERNVKLWIFPEGTRNSEGTSMLPFKKGAFHLAIQAQVPIVPVVFSSYSEFYSKKERRFSTGKFIITCLPPVHTHGLTSPDVSDLSEKVRKQMLDVFNLSSLEMTQVKLSNGIR